MYERLGLNRKGGFFVVLRNFSFLISFYREIFFFHYSLPPPPKVSSNFFSNLFFLDPLSVIDPNSLDRIFF